MPWACSRTRSRDARQGGSAWALSQVSSWGGCRYQHPSGQTRLRCTTLTRRWVDGSSPAVRWPLHRRPFAHMPACSCLGSRAPGHSRLALFWPRPPGSGTMAQEQHPTHASSSAGSGGWFRPGGGSSGPGPACKLQDGDRGAPKRAFSPLPGANFSAGVSCCETSGFERALVVTPPLPAVLPDGLRAVSGARA